MAASDADRAAPPRIVIHVGADYWRCRAWVTGLGECLAFVPLPADGSPPPQCWRGHYQPWYGTFERERRPAALQRSAPAAGGAEGAAARAAVVEHPRLGRLLGSAQFGDNGDGGHRPDLHLRADGDLGNRDVG